jgi:hypothetical protein
VAKSEAAFLACIILLYVCVANFIIKIYNIKLENKNE